MGVCGLVFIAEVWLSFENLKAVRLAMGLQNQ